MILIGDIGNTDIKIALFDKNKKLIFKKRFNPILLNFNNLSKHFKFLNRYFKYIDKILFCSVVPKKFEKIKKYLENITNKKCYDTAIVLLKGIAYAVVMLHCWSPAKGICSSNCY